MSGNKSDEAALLESMNASIQNQDVYEDQVLKSATHRLAPPIMGVGLPDLNALGPGRDHAAVHAVLNKVHRDLKTKETDNLLYMKEQLLLYFLQHTAGVTPEELPKADEQRRSRLLRQPKQSTESQPSMEKPESKPKKVSFQDEPPSTRKRPRISIMKRKQTNGMDDAEFRRRRDELKKLREERRKRKEENQRLLVQQETEDSSESEAEFGEETAPMKMEESEKESENENKKESERDNEANDDESRITCPLCNSSIDHSGRDPDEVLSLHMDQCQRKRRRSTRSNTSVVDVMEIDDDDRPVVRHALKKKIPKKRRAPIIVRSASARDDIEEGCYEDRVDSWIENGLSRMKDMKERDVSDVLPGTEEYEDGLHIPGWMNDRLFPYQRECVKWMWKLHREGAGGIVGDEMGLGKTVQVSAFLGALIGSRKAKSILVVAPATMLQHWLNELAVWAPGLRRILIHASGEMDGTSRNMSSRLLQGLAKWLKQARRDRLFEAIDEDDFENMPAHSFCGSGYVIVTTYENVRRNADVYTGHRWSYVVLDEAQKIRNPDAEVTLACKRLPTPHRLAMSGTPIQNDLRELWSLFDFVFPGRLGTLPAFEQEFSDAIKRGGYSNASPMQVQLAYRCALVLRDLISPYMLRRQKKEVKEVSRMPGKTEQVLFCRLSQRQRELYEAYIRSDEVNKVRRGSFNLLAAITMLRKICNHPDLVCDPDDTSFGFGRNNGTGISQSTFSDSDDDDGEVIVGDGDTLVERSGKLAVLAKILPLWKSQGHRVLIFCQWQKTLNIIEQFMLTHNWKFGRLDGKTNVAARQRFVDRFNTDESYFAAICTTRTGGVGLNLTGANRIIIFSPDWNPMTDQQAKERAWRFGQEREVTVYRLITAGTIEEKIYQRQIFKTALSNKILQDPRQRRLFSQRDLNDLFTLKTDTGSIASGGDGVTETTEIAQRRANYNDEPEPHSKDDQETIKTVLKSKGLAGVFDHSFVENENDNTAKKQSVREMETEAKKVAQEAVRNLQASVKEGADHFAPTWTGSEETTRRFGTSNGSGSLLAGLRQRASAVATNGNNGSKYTKLLARIKDYVYRMRPTTDDILKEFEDSIPDNDVAIFRSLLKSVARLENGRWRLQK